MTTITFQVDDDDERSINEAVAFYQKNYRWQDDQGGVFLPEGDSDLRGAIIGEICRGWMEMKGQS